MDMRKYFTMFWVMGGLCLISAPVFADPVITGPEVLNSRDVHDPGVRTINNPVWGTLNYKQFNKYGSTGETDSSDAPLPYSSTGNTKGQWQGLGLTNGKDDGVKWSVGGSAFGTTADLVKGEDVTFKFLFWQANNGRHDYDQIFIAFDFGQDGSWAGSDVVLYEKINTTNDVRTADDTSKRLSRYLEYTVTFTVPDTMKIGETWLRARATCWETKFGDVTANNWLGQGETEDYRLKIVSAPVPEPASLLLFGTGLIGLAGFARRRD